MRLAEFILQNPEHILAEWEKCARTILPATRDLSQAELRDHARGMLTTIARDMETAQSPAEQEQKSQGRRRQGAQRKDTPAEDYAGDRLIVNSGTRMERMVSDLLDFACTRLGLQLPILLRPMDIGGACRGTIEEIRAFYPDRKFIFSSTGELSGCWDEGRIGQMLSNLVGNAVEHGFAYEPILVSAYGSDKDVLIAVHNEGPAIPEDEQRRMFEPLQRGNANERPAQTGRSRGLGLYIACEIAMAHHGTIEVISSDQEGTTFVVELPRTLVPPERRVDIT